MAAVVVGLAAGLTPASPAGARVSCQVDSPSTIPAEYPNAQFYASVMGNGGCQIVYDYVVGALVGGSYTPPATTKIHFVPEGVGYATGGEIYLGYKYIQTRYNQFGTYDWGLTYHELAHVIQGYPAGANAQWVTEGLADWVRYDQGQPPLDHPSPDPGCSGHHYTEGYECAAAFLGWIDTRYRNGDHSFITLLNGAYHFGSGNTPALNMQILTGETIDQLWWNCLYEDCAGASSVPPDHRASPMPEGARSTTWAPFSRRRSGGGLVSVQSFD
jgi:hypothetical protein